MSTRPKPWEATSGTSTAIASGQTSEIPSTTTSLPTSLDSSAPARPTETYSTSSVNNNNINNYGTSSLGGYGSNSRYGGLGGYGSSMYGGMGGYGSSMYGGLGGYGSSMYGGMGGMGGMYGMGGYGMGGYGMNGDGNGGGFAESTQATFHIIESFIGAIAGFTQMLEATYMATHSSFFTMISVAEQFGNLKNALGSFLGIFTLIKWVKAVIRKLVGLRDNIKIDVGEFRKFETKRLQEGVKSQEQSKKSISLKPLLIFLGMVIGTPFILKKVIDYLNNQQLQRRLSHQLGGATPGQTQQVSLDSIEFGRVLYDFFPENPTLELELKKNDLVAILMKTDPMGRESQWWKVRSREGKEGYFPANYVQILPRQLTSGPANDSAENKSNENDVTVSVQASSSV